MGVKNLYKFIKAKAPESVSHHKSLKELAVQSSSNLLDSDRNFTVAIDTSNIMYKLLASTQTIKKGSKNHQLPAEERHITQPSSSKLGIQTGHVMGVIYKSINMLEEGIEPLWIFDGAPLAMKDEEIAKRKDKKSLNQSRKLDSLSSGDLDLALKYSKRSISISDTEIDCIKQCIHLMGLRHLQAQSEADHFMAKLSHEKEVDLVMSDDGDLLVYGVDKLVRSATVKIGKQEHHELISLEKLLQALKWSQDQLIDFAILSGTDYNSNVKGIGPVASFQLIQKYKSIDCIISDPQMSERYDWESICQFGEIRENFKNGWQHEIIEKKRAGHGTLDFGQNSEKAPRRFNPSELSNFLAKEIGFRQTRVDNIVRRLEASFQNIKNYQNRAILSNQS